MKTSHPMKIWVTRLVSAVVASSAGCAWLLYLLYAPLFSPGTFSMWRQWTPLNETMEENPVTGHFSMLVEGEDQRQLRSIGFSCRKDVHAHVYLSTTQVRIQALENQELKIYQPYPSNSSLVESIKPYARQEDEATMERVSPVNIFYGTISDIPQCDVSHNVPAVVFSGVAGNLFHELSEIIVPLFLTCHHFNKQVQLVITDSHPSTVQKYKSVWTHLSSYDLITLKDKRVHCFQGGIIGLKYHSNLGINFTQIPKGYDMSQFRNFLRESYSLRVSKVKHVLPENVKPVLLLISRRGSRVFLIEDEMVAMMTLLGYEVIVADPNMTTDLDKFSKVVNQCSVIVGAHGAGMTNLVFLPAGAVVIQVVPLGLDWASDAYFGEPVSNMDLNYMLYKIEPDESSLVDVYGRDHPVITNPMTVFAKGYKAARTVYVDGQNLMINVPRFRETLIEAQKLLNISSIQIRNGTFSHSQ